MRRILRIIILDGRYCPPQPTPLYEMSLHYTPPNFITSWNTRRRPDDGVYLHYIPKSQAILKRLDCVCEGEAFNLYVIHVG